MEKSEFWHFFDNNAEKLLQREVSFRKMFKHLDSNEGPVVIVETGCVRNPDPWAMTGEGQSTLLFDKYVSTRNDGSITYSVDISPQAVAVSKSLVSGNVEIHEGDSVAFLDRLTRDLSGQARKIDLLYLDSYDVDYNFWFASAARRHPCQWWQPRSFRTAPKL